MASEPLGGEGGGFRPEVQPRRQHWFLNRKSGFHSEPRLLLGFQKGQRRLGEKEHRARSVTPGVALRVGIQGGAREKCTGHGNVVQPLRTRLRAASGGRSQLAPRVPRNSARRPQSVVELKWPDGAELDRWSIRARRVDENIVGRRQSNTIRRRVARHARSQATPYLQGRATPPMQSSVSACKPAG